MAINPKPDIKVIFMTLARTIIQRSARGVLYVLVDDSKQTNKYTEIVTIGDIDETKWDEKTVKYLKLAMTVGPNSPKKIVVRNKLTDQLTAILKEFEVRKMTHLACPQLSQPDDLTVVAWVKQTWQNKGVTYASSFVDDADNVGIIYVPNDIFDTSLGRFNGQEFTVGYMGLFAGMPLNRSGDNIVLSGVDSVDDKIPTNGHLVAYNDDDKVRIVYAINSKTTFDSTWKKDTRKIKVVEGMNIVRFDIQDTFKNYWLGLYINSYDNKMAFNNIVNEVYFKELQPNVLSTDYDNLIDVDEEKQREAVIADGKDPNEMTELEIRRFPTADNVYLGGDVRFSDTMANLSLIINM